MGFIAHASVVLETDYSSYEKDRWELILQKSGLRFHRRLSSNNLYEVACEMFAEKEKALTAAKYIYTQIVYNLLYKGIRIAFSGCQFYEKRFYDPLFDGNKDNYPESSFFWTPKCRGGGIGVDVYEVKDSFNEFDELYKGLGVTLPCLSKCTAQDLEFYNYDKSPFLYNRESHRLLNTLIQADSILDIGLQMTLYCGLLDHLAPEKNKSEEVLSVLDLLIQQVRSSNLNSTSKNTLTSYLENGKRESTRRRCLEFCGLYAKEWYGKFKLKEIFEDAYSIRSAYSHGEDCDNRYSGPAPYIKFVVLDVLSGYMRAKA